MTQPNLMPVLCDGGEFYQLFPFWTFIYRGNEVVIPENYVTDGASVPRMAWWFMPPDGVHRAAALEHDWFYDNKGKIESETVTREEADMWFLKRMLEGGTSNRRATVAYKIVRMFGGKAWEDSKNTPRIFPPLPECPTIIRPVTSPPHIYQTPSSTL